MSRCVKYTARPVREVRGVPDFLPPPDELAQVTHEYQVSADSSRARSCEVLRRTVAPRRKPNVV
jgi:hypothetical protein